MFLKTSQSSQENICARVSGLGLQLYQKTDSNTDVFAVNFVKFLRTPLLQNTSGRLLLYVISTHSNTALSKEKTFQRLNIAYRVLSKDALTSNHVRCVSSNQIIHEIDKII